MKNLFVTDMPRDMHSRIMAKIVSERIAIAKRKLVVFISGTVAALALFVATLEYTITQFAQSEFPRYLSLIYSDTSLISVYWKDLTYSFVASIPLVSVIFLLLSTFILLAIFRKTIQNFGMENNIKKLLEKKLVTA